MPNKLLMDEYRTRSVYLEKCAGEASVAFRLAAVVAGLATAKRVFDSVEEQQRENAIRFRSNKVDPRVSMVSRELHYTRPPVVIPAMMPGSSDLSGPPVGMDAGMVRLASAGQRIGQKLAGVAGTAAGIGALLGAAYLGNKTLNKGIKYMSEEADPTDWSGARYGKPQLPYGVNEYGQAQMGTPFVSRLRRPRWQRYMVKTRA